MRFLHKKVYMFGLSLFLVLVVSKLAMAIPSSLVFQGIVRDASGTALQGVKSVTTKLYDGSSSTELLSEESTVTFNNGAFRVEIGKTSPIAFSAVSKDSVEVELTLTLNGKVEKLPRMPLVSTPYALVARDAITAQSLASSATIPASQVTGLSSSSLASTALTSNYTAGSITLNAVAITSAGLSTSGTVTANKFIGDGSSLTNISATVSTNVVTNNYAPALTLTGLLTASSITVSGIVSANRFEGDGGDLLNVITTNYTNASPVTLNTRVYINNTVSANFANFASANIATTLNFNVGNTAVVSFGPGSYRFTTVGLTKTFIIQHPQDAQKYLVHAVVEGPENAVFYRGSAKLKNGQAQVMLPSYFEALARPEGRTVQLTPVKGWSPLYVVDDIKDGKFGVRAAGDDSSTQEFYWEVKAIRKDVAAPIVEPNKTDVDVLGDGPYKYYRVK